MIDYILLNESLFTNVLLIMGDTNPCENQYLNVVAPCKMSYRSKKNERDVRSASPFSPLSP